MIRSALLAFLALCSGTCCFGQDSSWKPTSPLPFGFDSVAIAKVYKNQEGEQVLGLITFQLQQQSYQVTKYRTETKTRTVTDEASGKQTAETYGVQVPYQEQMTRTIHVPQRFEVPLEHCRVWTINNKQIASSELPKLLSAPKRSFVMQRKGLRNIETPVDAFHSNFFRDDVMVVWYDKEKATKIKQTPAPK